MPDISNNQTNWKAKLLAFLHDPPHKPFRIAGNENQRASALIACGLDVEEMRQWQKQPDWTAAAADRLIFPDPAASNVHTDWRDENLAFIHPLAGTRLEPRYLPSTADVAEDWVNCTMKGIADAGHSHQANFIRIWRLWRDHAADLERHEVLAYLVADTRVPDHTLWQHNSIVSALETCTTAANNERHIDAAFLLFQIGPVQDFIAQARKTQDLWSGSYLLSFLIAQGMLAIADEVGPDVIVYPLLRGIPLADWHWKQTGWLHDGDALHTHPNELLIPSLPNRFLAVLPRTRAVELAELAAHKIRGVWKNIHTAVRQWLDQQIRAEYGDRFNGWDVLWDEQLSVFPQIDYVVHNWKDTETALREAAAGQPPLHDLWPVHPLHLAELWAKDMIPPEHRDPRCYKHVRRRTDDRWHYSLLDDGGNPLLPKARPLIDNPGFAWPLHYATADWFFAAKKLMRRLNRWHGYPRPKDALDGRTEVIGPEGNVAEFWDALRTHPVLGEKEKQEDRAERHFVGRQSYGALTIVKRLWTRASLSNQNDVPQPFFDFDAATCIRKNFRSVIEIASGKKETWDETDEQLRLLPEEAYYAVLCFDGDEMGKWVSGAKAPPLLGQLSSEARHYFDQHWRPEIASELKANQVRRLLTPAYHAALSEALNHFALYCVRPVIQRFGGQLIYCGGDDVLAMLPAASALACAEALYWTFRGQLPDTADVDEVLNSPALDVLAGRNGLFEFLPKGEPDTLRGGFVRIAEPLQNQPRWPFIVPGPRATASVGIAVGHVRSPMQDTIQAARDAEQQAKKHYGRDAFCLRILKRSGEALEIGGHWRDTDPQLADPAKPNQTEEHRLSITRRHPRLVLIESLITHLATPITSGVSGRLPYQLGQLLRPLGLDAILPPLARVLRAETHHVLQRQAENLREHNEQAFIRLQNQTDKFLESLARSPNTRVRDYLNPFLAAAWLAKHPGCAHTSTETKPSTAEVHNA